MNRFKPTLFLSFGLVSLTLGLTLTAYLFGLLPDGYRAELNSRAKVAESLAVQLATAVNKNDSESLRETMRSVVTRNDDIYSTAFRDAQGKILLSAGDHAAHWIASQDGKSTPTHVTVPLLGAKGKQGTIEMAFGPPSAGGRFLGIPISLFLFLAYLLSAGFIGYFFLLRRSLKELDPGRVIPERVQKAFDTLSESVIIIDEKERILLVNEAFQNIAELDLEHTIGSKISALSWRMIDGGSIAGGYPWHLALRAERETREEALSLRTSSGEIHNFNINATVIRNEKDKAIGAIVTLRDRTLENQTQENLVKTLQRLEETEEHIAQQNRELTYLNTHDTLSGCLNRAEFFHRFSADTENAMNEGHPIIVLMVGIDNFDEINSRLGPATGDKIIAEIANRLRVMSVSPSYVARYRGDEFCVAMPHSTVAKAAALTEALRETIQRNSTDAIDIGEKITISIGLAIVEQEHCTAHELVHRASRALTSARQQGTSQIQNWDGMALKDQQVVSNTAIMPPPAPASNFAPPMGEFQTSRDEVSQLSKDEAIQAAAAVAQTKYSDHIQMAIEKCVQDDKKLTVLHLRIDAWDYLLEALGDSLCELLMRSVKRQIEPSVRDPDQILFLGNNGEMLIFIDNLEQVDDVHWTVSRLLDATKRPIDLPEGKIYASCHVGAAVFPDTSQSAETLIRHSTVALRRACFQKPVEGYLVFDSAMVKTSKERLEIETGIREALENNEFALSFQPIIDVKTGALSAAEALLRCSNPRLMQVRMDHVIDVAERSSLIAEVDMWVMRSALKQMHAWCDAGLKLPKVSINISAKQLTNIPFMDQVHDLISQVRFAPSRVQIEVTETAKMADVDIAAPQLKRLQNLGVHIALDDFGTGQASLTYLQRLHPDVIKLDRSFITDVQTNHANATMVSAVTVMAHCLGLKVVAEGVEEDDQLTFLRDTHVDEIQGYLVSKPMPGTVMTEWLGVFVAANGTTDHVNRLDQVDEAQSGKAA